MEAAARNAFNLKVLRRHDPSITEIMESASFIVLYSHKGEWTKTGVEGPMFLFRRNVAPYNGFFIINRNGVENFSADVTPDDDLEITPEFIIYRPETSSENDVYGIWVFEPSQRLIIGEQMLKLQQMSLPPAPPLPEVPTTNGQNSTPLTLDQDGTPPSNPISLDALFGSASQATLPTSESATQKEKSADVSLLDALFQKATTSSSIQPSETIPPASQPALDVRVPIAKDSFLNLLAQLMSRPPNTPKENPIDPNQGHPSCETNGNVSNPVSKDSPKSTETCLPELEKKGKKCKNQSQKATDRGKTQSETPCQVKPDRAPKMSELIAEGTKGRVGLGDDGQPLSRREFVTELLSLIHTEPDFVNQLYQAYTSSVS